MAGPFDDLIPGQARKPYVIPGPPPAPSPKLPVDVANTAANTARTQQQMGIDAQRLIMEQERLRLDQSRNRSRGQDAVDETFGKEYAVYKAAGGFADVQKQLAQLREARARLARENITGPIVGRTPDFINSFVNPNAISTRETVEEVVQRSLRQILGVQFTENEGTRLIARSYNPTLSEAENHKRVTRLYNQLATAAKAKESASRYFEKNGTLAGWKGKLWTVSDFDPDGSKPSAAPPRVGGGTLRQGKDGVLEWHP